jgi:hypothetical protein
MFIKYWQGSENDGLLKSVNASKWITVSNIGSSCRFPSGTQLVLKAGIVKLDYHGLKNADNFDMDERKHHSEFTTSICSGYG